MQFSWQFWFIYRSTWKMILHPLPTETFHIAKDRGVIYIIKYEPPHDKTNKISVRPAKSQISLGICPVWSESSPGAQWVGKDPSFLHADRKDWSDWADDQADLSLRWAHMPFCWFCHEAAHIWNRKAEKTDRYTIVRLFIFFFFFFFIDWTDFEKQVKGNRYKH